MRELDKNRFLTRASRLLDEIDQLLSACATERPNNVDRFDLEVASKHIVEMRSNVETGTLAPKEQRFPVLARLVVDQWPLGSELGTELIELEKLYQLL